MDYKEYLKMMKDKAKDEKEPEDKDEMVYDDSRDALVPESEVQTDTLAREEMRDPQGMTPKKVPCPFADDEMRKMAPNDLLNYFMKSQMMGMGEAPEDVIDDKSGTSITIVLLGG